MHLVASERVVLAEASVSVNIFAVINLALVDRAAHTFSDVNLFLLFV